MPESTQTCLTSLGTYRHNTTSNRKAYVGTTGVTQPLPRRTASDRVAMIANGNR
jgi:hypothetical protein